MEEIDVKICLGDAICVMASSMMSLIHTQTPSSVVPKSGKITSSEDKTTLCINDRMNKVNFTKIFQNSESAG
jgi:hypothetical protein